MGCADHGHDQPQDQAEAQGDHGHLQGQAQPFQVEFPAVPLHKRRVDPWADPVQLFIWTFVIFPSVRNKVLIGFIGLGVNSGAYVAEIVRGGLMSVDIGQSEASRSLGMNYLDTMRFIVVPQAFKNILPSLGNEFITLFKDTSLVQAIGGTELLYYASTIGGRTFDYMPPLIGIAVMYLVVVIVLTWLQSKLERRLRQSDRR